MSPTLTPEVLWAQRSNPTDAVKNIVYLTINCAEITPDTLKIDITSSKVTFSGTNHKGVSYAVDLELYAEIDPAESKKHVSPRGVEFVLRKKEAKAEYWPRLLKESRKMHFLKTDFDKWVDEDEQDEKDDVGFGGDDFGGMDGGMGGLDFSKLAASQGLGDMSGIPTGTGADSDDDDEDMPELEDTGAKNQGIEEITETK